MNAITVNYAEVGDDHIPVSFGFVRNSDLSGQTVYNSKITKINDTCSILQGRDIGTKDIIVSSDTKDNRLLSSFTSGTTGWIQHRIPEPDKTTYIFYNSDGYYYKMVENTDGKPVQEKYAPYACLTNVKDNANSQPYCEATIETPVALNIADGKIKAIIDGSPVEIANTEVKLTLQLENADDNNFTSQIISESEYTISNYFSLDGIVWARDGRPVSAWLLDNKIVKSSDVVKGVTHQIKMLAGDNIVKIFRKRSDITAKFNFTNPEIQSFEDGGASSNGAEDSYMSGNSLIIPRVKHGRPQINLLDFFNNAQAGWFSPSATLNGPISEQTTFNIGVKIPTPTDTLIFTGWLNGHLVQENQIKITHKRLPQTIIVSGINTDYLGNITVKDNGGLLVHAGGNKFTRSGDFSSQTFTATAHYTNIPAVVSVNNPSDTAVASNNQVVLFENIYYVANGDIKTLVEKLVSNVTVIAKKEVIKFEAKVWQTTVKQAYYKVTTTPTESPEPIEPTYNYTLESNATITISGNGDEVSSVSSSDPNLTVSYTSLIDETTLKIAITYTVPAGFSLSENETITTLYNTVPVLESTRNQKITYKFFN